MYLSTVTSSWVLLIAVLASMGGLILYVTWLNMRLRYSKRKLEAEISERKRIEEKLAENENRLREIIASEPECVKLQTLDGILLEMNPAGLVLMEADRAEELIGTSVYDMVAPEFREGYRALTESVFVGESGVMEFQIISLKGRRRWMETHAVPLRDGNGKVMALLGITRDITARKHAEDEVRLHYRELAHAARITTMGEMASGLAHELNQPLSAIANYSRGCLHRIRSGSGTAEDMIQAIEQVCNQADRAANIIRTLRNFINKESNAYHPHGLNEIVQDALLIAMPEVKLHKVELRLALDKDLPKVLANAIQIEQVVLNLVRNAVEAMDELPPEHRLLELQSFLGRDMAALEVRNTGPGLSREMLNRIFDPFFTTKPSGMGMGLAISKSIIEAHGGTLVGLPNESGKGLRFRFTLPLATEEVAHA